MRSFRIPVAASLALLFATPILAADDCHLYRLASIDMTIDAAGGVNVPMSISGKDVTLLVDTGGIFSSLNDSIVTELGLRKESLMGAYFMMFGGKKITQFVGAKDIKLGRLTANRTQFLVMPDGLLPQGIGGTLAPDVLNHYDVDFDFANAKFGLFSTDHCDGRVVYWTDDYAVVGFRRDDIGHIRVPVKLDGQDVDARIDTGASRSIMALETAEDVFNIDPKSPDLKDQGQHSFGHAYKYPFKVLTFSGVTVNNPDIMLVSEHDSKFRETILGMGILRQLHVYFANREKRMYVSAASATRDTSPSAATATAPPATTTTPH